MGEEEAPDLLLDQFRLSGAEDGAWSALVRLEFVEHKFRLPALMVRRGELDGRDLIRAGDIRDQGYDLFALSSVRDLVIDDPDVKSGQVGDLSQAVAKPVEFLAFSFESAMNER